MNIETSSPQHEHEIDREIKPGDVLFVSRNLKNEEGMPLLDDEGKQQTKLEDGWEVVDLAAINPSNGREGILLRNTNDSDELKFYSNNQLLDIQTRAEQQIMDRAANVATAMLGEIDQGSKEIAERESRIPTEEAEKIGEEVVEVAQKDVANTEPAVGTIADIMSGEKPGLKFDVEAAIERQRKEQEQALVPLGDLDPARAAMSEILRQFDMSRGNQEGAIAFRHTLEANLVEESRHALNALKRGRNPHAVALEEGFLIASARTPDALRVIQSQLTSSELFNEADLDMLSSVFVDIATRMQRGGPEGEHFHELATRFDMLAENLLKANNGEATEACSAVMGMVIGLTGRIGPEAQGYAYQRLTTAIDDMRRFKKPEV